jgi:F-type H+-transporting ATPase subunit epsilon
MSVPFSYAILTPDGVFRSGECEFLVLPTPNGEMGVLANHTSLVGAVKAGQLRITREGAVEKIAVTAGVVEIRENKVSVMVEKASPVV